MCVATIGESGISVISPDGELVEFVSTDDVFTTNICFGGADMQDAYLELHRLGHAHSAEVFDGERLVGGIYGVAIGRSAPR